MLSTQLELFADLLPPLSCGKTSPEFSIPPTTPSDAFWLDWPERMTRWNRQGVNGRTQVWLLDPRAQSRGGSSTPNISEWPNDAVVCSLWQVLEPSTHPRYFLSATACAGILRRAEKRGKALPELLHRALLAVATGTGERALV